MMCPPPPWSVGHAPPAELPESIIGLGAAMIARVEQVSAPGFRARDYPGLRPEVRLGEGDGWAAWHILPVLRDVLAFATWQRDPRVERVRAMLEVVHAQAAGFIYGRLAASVHLSFDGISACRTLIEQALKDGASGAGGRLGHHPTQWDRINGMLDVPPAWAPPPRTETDAESVIRQLRAQGRTDAQILSALEHLQLVARPETAELRRKIQAAADQPQEQPAVRRSTGSQNTADLSQPGPGGTSSHALQPGTQGSGPEDRGTSAAVFRREGGIWRVRFGGIEGSFVHRHGMAHLAHLLSRPNPQQAVPALELAGSSPAQHEAEHTPQDVLDATAMKQYRDRLEELDEALGPERRCYGSDELAKFEAERAEIKTRLNAATGLRGKSRRLGGPGPAERARKAVYGAIGRAYEVFRDSDPPMTALEEHLRTSIHTEGAAFAYRPGPESPSWVL